MLARPPSVSSFPVHLWPGTENVSFLSSLSGREKEEAGVEFPQCPALSVLPPAGRTKGSTPRAGLERQL